MALPPEKLIYLDHAAATPLAEAVAAAMAEVIGSGYANPSSPHTAGRRAKQLLEDAREEILERIGGRTGGAARDRLVFTSGATEANRLGILGQADGESGWIGTSARDHASIQAAAAQLAAAGWQWEQLPLSRRGTLAGEPLRTAGAGSSAGRRILAITTVCGQTGIEEDLAAVPAPAAASLSIHADLTQQVAWEPIAFHDAAFTTAALAACKCGGPPGIGALVIRHGVRLRPLAPGPQELGLRGGTEAVPLAVGFAKAVAVAAADRAAVTARVRSLRDRLERGLLAAAAAAGIEALIVGQESPRAAHIAMLGLAGIDRQAAAMAADMAGVCLATGPACASGSSEPPAVLAAMGLPRRFHQSCLRLSLAGSLTPAMIDAAVDRLRGVFFRLAG